MVHDVIILIPFFNFSHNNHKSSFKHFCLYILFPWKGTLTDARDGDGGEKNSKNNFVLNVFPPEENLD